MKKYRNKNEVLVFQWTGDVSIIDNINDVLKSYNEKGDCILKVGLNENNVLYAQCKENDMTSNEFMRLNEYVVFDVNDKIYPLRGYSEENLNKKYIEL